jgi:hypothetical protein
VEIEPVEAEQLAALHFIEECFARFVEAFLFRVPEIDQVAVVRQDLEWLKTKLLAISTKKADVGFCQRRGLPLALIFGKQGKGFRPDF